MEAVDETVLGTGRKRWRRVRTSRHARCATRRAACASHRTANHWAGGCGAPPPSRAGFPRRRLLSPVRRPALDRRVSLLRVDRGRSIHVGNPLRRARRSRAEPRWHRRPDGPAVRGHRSEHAGGAGLRGEPRARRSSSIRRSACERCSPGRRPIGCRASIRTNRSKRSVKYWRAMIDAKVEMPSGIVVLTVRAFTPTDAVRIADAVLDASENLVNALNDRMREDALAQSQSEQMRAAHEFAAARAALEQGRNIERSLDARASAAGAHRSDRGRAAPISSGCSQELRCPEALFRRNDAADAKPANADRGRRAADRRPSIRTHRVGRRQATFSPHR